MPVSPSRRLLGAAFAGTALVALAACGAPVDETAASGTAGSTSTSIVPPHARPTSHACSSLIP